MYRLLFILFCLCVSTSFLSLSALDSKESGFQIRPVTSSEQLDPNVSYYHIPFESNKKTTLEFILENFSDSEKTINIEVSNALSSPLVNIDYQPREQTFYSSFTDNSFSMKPFISIPDSIILKPNEKSTHSFFVSVPFELSEGEILGAISFYEKKIKNNDKKKKSSEMHVKIQQKYTIAILLDTGIEAKSNIDASSVTLDVNTGKPILYLNILNNTPSIVNGLVLTYTVSSYDEEAVMFEDKINVKTLSPKTSMKQPIHWDKDFLETGNYSIDFSIRDKMGVELFSSKEDFLIEEDDVDELIAVAEKTNKNITVISPKTPSWTWVLLGAVVLFLSYRFFAFIRNRSVK